MYRIRRFDEGNVQWAAVGFWDWIARMLHLPFGRTICWNTEFASEETAREELEWIKLHS